MNRYAFLAAALALAACDASEPRAYYDADIGKRLSANGTEKFRGPKGKLLMIMSRGGAEWVNWVGNEKGVFVFPIRACGGEMIPVWFFVVIIAGGKK